MESSELIGEVKIDTSSYKTRVMAVLADAPLNMLTNKEMLWAASNLPDTKVKGTFETKMSFAEADHNSESLYKAFDISEEELKSFGKIMRDSVEHMYTFPKEEQTNSISIEYIVEKLGNNPKYVLSLIIKVMGDAAGQASLAKSGFTEIPGLGILGAIKGSELKELLKKLMGDLGGERQSGSSDGDGLDF
jgi:hypothetical protein